MIIKGYRAIYERTLTQGHLCTNANNSYRIHQYSYAILKVVAVNNLLPHLYYFLNQNLVRYPILELKYL